MHAPHGEVVLASVIEHADARLSCCFGVHIVGRSLFGMLQLECCTMNEVANHQDTVYLKHGVTRRVSVGGKGLHATGQCVAGFKKVEM